MSTKKILELLGAASGAKIPVSVHVSGAEFIGLIAVIDPDGGEVPDTAILFGVKYVGTKPTGEVIYDPSVAYIVLSAIAAFERAYVPEEEIVMMETLLKAHIDGTKPPAQFVCKPKPPEPPPRAGQLTPEEIANLTRDP